MADIFLSYNEKDRPRVRQLAQALECAGWSVWWDRRVPAGMTWRSLLEQELQNMRCMLVLWSANSVKSEWVCEEATEGRLLGRLIPVFIERVRPPAGFREVQAADLVDWDGSKDFIGLQQLLDDIGHKLGAPSVVAKDLASRTAIDDPLLPPPPPPPPAPTPWKPWGIAATVLLMAVGIYLGLATVARRQTVVPAAQPPAASTPSATVIAEPPAAQPSSATVTARPPSPITTPAMVIAPKPAIKPPSINNAATPKPLWPARCGAIQDRQVMGETPSAADQAFFDKEC